jgi:FlaA1/EpsC-like NDP-sugar epimerase
MRNISRHFVSRRNRNTGRRRQVSHLVFTVRREQETNEHLLKSTGKENNIMSATSDIPGFFKERCVFITGGTGFMGKVLVEKLLRSCPDVDTIYLLTRPKGGNDIRIRHEELIRCQVRRGCYQYRHSTRRNRNLGHESSAV